MYYEDNYGEPVLASVNLDTGALLLVAVKTRGYLTNNQADVVGRVLQAIYPTNVANAVLHYVNLGAYNTTLHSGSLEGYTYMVTNKQVQFSDGGLRSAISAEITPEN